MGKLIVPSGNVYSTGRPRVWREGDHILGSGIISSTLINALSTGAHNLFTVPSNCEAIITGALIRGDRLNNVTGVGAVGIGIAAGEDDIYASATLTGLTEGKSFLMSNGTALRVTAQAGDVIKCGVDTAFTISGSNPTSGNINNAVIINTFTTSTQTGSNARGGFIGDSGTKMYIITYNRQLYQYNLSSAYDLSTASYSGNTVNVYTGGGGTAEYNPLDVAFSSDGLKVFIAGVSQDGISEFTLSSAWDLSSTWTYIDSFSCLVGTETNMPSELEFKPDGTRFWVSGDNGIHEFECGTAWDISTASHVKSRNLANIIGEKIGCPRWKSDGLRAWCMSLTYNNYELYEFVPETAWDIDSLHYTGRTKDLYGNSIWNNVSMLDDDGNRWYSVGTGATREIDAFGTGTADIIVDLLGYVVPKYPLI